MEKQPFSNKQESKESKGKEQFITEDEYVQKCVDYALSLGWIKEDRKDLLVKRYLKPLYKHCLDILEEIKKDSVPEEDYNKIVQKLNWCLEATRRFGSTDTNNILKTIEDYRRNTKSVEEDYALESFYNFASELLNS